MRIPWRWLACLLFLVTFPSFAAERSWRMATTPHYTLLTQLGERESASWMRNFDQFILSTSEVLQIDLRALPPLTIVIFDRDKDFAAYKLLLPSGQTANVAGQFVRRPTWSMIGMAQEKDNEEFRRTIHHEATHWLMSVDQARQPAWFSEGIAEMFSTFERKGDKVTWAKPIAEHLALLNGAGEMPLAQFLIQPSALFDREDHTSRFYAQSWAFTHFLLLSKDPARRQLLFKFLETYKNQSGEATVQTVFGSSLKDTERAFQIFANQRSFFYMTQPVKPAAEPPALQAAPAAFVEAALGLLAHSAGHTELARRHAEKSIALDAQSPEGPRVLAYLAMDDDEFEDAAAQAEAALQRGSKDSELFMLMGDSYVRGENRRKPDAKVQRVHLYENAINLSPRRLAIYQRLTEALLELEKPREEDAKFLQLGLTAFPGEDWLRVGTAMVNYRLGKRDVAMTTLETVLRPDGTLGPEQRRYATQIRALWLMDSLKAEINAAVAKRDYAGARALIASYRERVGDQPEIVRFLEDFDTKMQLGELMNRYDEARRASKKTEARALAEQLLARPDLPPDLRNYLQQGAAAAAK